MLRLTEVVRSRARLSTLPHWTQDPCSLSHTSCWVLAPSTPTCNPFQLSMWLDGGHAWNGDPLFSHAALAVEG